MLNRNSDAALVGRVLAGQRDDFGLLVERHLPAAFAVAYGRTGNHADAEDAAQEAFLRALKTLDRLREPAKFGPWLLTIARNVATDILITRTRERNAGSPIPDEDDAVWLPNMEQSEMWSKLHEQIRQLEDEPREVLMLFYFAGKRTKEIAALLNLSNDVVRKRLQRARETLGTRLLDELQPERKLEPVLKKRSATITAAALTAPVAWQSAGAATVPAIAGIAMGKWLAGVVLVAVGLMGVFVATRENERPIPAAQESERTERVASAREDHPAIAQASNALQSPTDGAPRTDASVPATTDAALNVIRGRVVDAVTGEGVSLGVTLTGKIVGDEEIYERGNEDGAFEIDVSKRGYGAFTVSCRNYHYYPFASVDGVRRPGEAIPEIVLKVRELATISGVVLHDDGSPAPRASIMRRLLNGNRDTEATADGFGRYVVRHQGGRIVLSARDDMLWSDEVAFEPAADESIAHDFVLPESGEIRISLRTTDGAIVQGIEDSVLATEGVTAPYLFAERVSDNEYLVKNLPYDVYTIVLRAPGYEPAEITGIQIDARQPTASVGATLRPGRLYNLTVRVLDPDGKPFPGAGVVLDLVTERLDSQGNVQAVLRNAIGANGENTDANGEWSTSGLPAGTYNAWCNDAVGNGETTVTVPAERLAILQLVRRDSVYYRLEVVDAIDNDRPLSNLEVTRWFVHADGTVSENMAPGTNHVIIVKEGYTAYLDTIDARVETSGDPILIRAKLGEGGTVEGTVRNANGTPQPLNDLYVFPELLWSVASGQWSDSWKNLGRTLAQRATSDASGSFSIGHLPQGRYVVALIDGTVSDPIDVLPGMVTGPVDIVSE